MSDTRQAQEEQAELWNGRSGHAWVDLQELLDHVLRPFEELLTEAAAARGGGRILDVGCGTGATTLAAARRLGPQGRCTGVDISAPMIAAARARAEREGVPAEFVVADAQTHPFDEASIDLIVSRFGVMFFADPVEAFTNLRRAAAEDAELRLLVWRSPAENAFMTAAAEAAAQILPDLPDRQPDAPGQFAFEDPDDVRTILAESGWDGVDIQPIDVVCAMPEPQLGLYLTRLGPVGLALQDADERTRARAIETIRPAFDRFVDGDEVRFTAACWTIGATAAHVSVRR